MDAAAVSLSFFLLLPVLNGNHENLLFRINYGRKSEAALAEEKSRVISFLHRTDTLDDVEGIFDEDLDGLESSGKKDTWSAWGRMSDFDDGVLQLSSGRDSSGRDYVVLAGSGSFTKVVYDEFRRVSEKTKFSDSPGVEGFEKRLKYTYGDEGFSVIEENPREKTQTETFFDASGSPLKIRHYRDDDGNLVRTGTFLYAYDTEGRKVSEEEVHYSADGKRKGRTRMEFTYTGRSVYPDLKCFENKKLRYSVEYVNDDESVKKTYYGDDFLIVTRIKDGQVIEEEIIRGKR